MEERLDRRGGPPPTRVHGPAERTALPTDPRSLPALPHAYELALDQGLAALGLELPPPARAAIDGHVRLLLAWNPAINLTAITDPATIAVRHVVDSLTAVPLLTGSHSILDLGSGGGFPGIPLAAALAATEVTLVDSVAKKARFLDVAVAATGLAGRVTVRAARAESLAGGVRHEAVLARAVGSLAELVELSMPLLDVGGRLIAWKRGDLAVELAAARAAARVLGADPPTVHPVLRADGLAGLAGLEGHALVQVRKARVTPAGYPRDPGVRRSRPWEGIGA